MPTLAEEMSWLIGARGTTPIAQGWLQNAGGAGPSITADKEYRPSTSGTNGAYVVRRLISSDPVRSAPVRTADDVELQWQFHGLTNAPSGWAATGVHGLFVDDGNRVAGVAIGPKLEWINPYTGDVIAEIRPGWPWQALTQLLLLKLGSEQWQLWQDGILLAELAYDAAPASQSVSVVVGGVARLITAARAGWGRLNTAGAGDGRWNRVELGVNQALPRQWKVDRAFATMPAPLRNRRSDNHEAIVRAALGEAQQAENAMQRAWPVQTAGRIVQEQISFSGELLPWVEDARWIVVGDVSNFAVVAQRIALAPADDAQAVSYAVDTTEIGEYLARATFLVSAIRAIDVQGRTGPTLQILNGHRRVTAQLLWSEAAQAYGWLVHGGATSGAALGGLGNTFWPVNPWVEHVVELRVLRRDRVVLVVDERIVDDIPYTRFATSTALHQITIGKADDAVLDLDMSMRLGLAEVAFTDQATRPAWLETLAEQLVFVGGREAGSRLEAWGSLHPGVHAARGSLVGLRTEYRRIAGHDDIDLHRTRDPASWFIDRTFPGITPVFLDAPGFLTDVFIEFYADIPNYPPDAFCDLIHRYLAPMSVFEMQVHCALITDLTGSPVTLGTSSFPVADLTGFGVGDAVQLRETTHGTMASITYEHDDQQIGADAAWVQVDPDGRVGGRYEIDAEGQLGLEITGTLTFPGLSGDKDGNLGANGTVTIVGGAAGCVGKAFVVGADAGGNPQVETLVLAGTTPVVGSLVFLAGSVAGVFCAQAQPSTVTLTSTVGAVQLYQIVAGNGVTGGGCLAWAPMLLAGPSQVAISADAATTAKLLVVGISLAGTLTAEIVTLAGTSLVVTSTVWRQVRAVPLGNIPAARTLTLRAQLHDRTAVVHLVSSSASDTQTVWIVGYDSEGAPLLETLKLTGTTPVVGSQVWSGRVAGVRLFGGVAVGTITFGLTSGAGPSTPTFFLGTIPPGSRTAGYHRVSASSFGRAQVTLDQVATIPRTVVIAGYRADTGELAADAVTLDGSTVIDAGVDFGSIDGVATGALPDALYATLIGTAFVADDLLEAQNALNPLAEWTISGVTDDQAVLDAHAFDRGPELGMRDQKPERHATALANWPVRYATGKTGSAPGLSEVTPDATTGDPIASQTPSAVDQFAYTLTGASLTDFEALWASGTFAVFFRFRRATIATAGREHVISANGGSATTAEQVGVEGVTGLRARYNGVNHNETIAKAENTWISAALVMSANSSTWYCDGAVVGSPVAHGGAGTATLCDLLRNVSTSDHLDFADLAIYQRALTGGEVATLHADTGGLDALRRDPSLWAHYLDPARSVGTAFLGSAVALVGDSDDLEGTQILSIDPDTLTVETSALLGTFTGAAVLRKILE